ncbi:MAG: hypothetical protein AMXMBFR84_08170 [Candidatus Hydrogenedentota bacterium]
MKNCRGREEALVRYADNDLPPQDVPELEQHLGVCEVCARVLREHRKALLHMTSAFASPSVYVDQTQTIFERPTKNSRWRTAMALGAVLLVAGAMAGYIGTRNAGRTAPTESEVVISADEVIALKQRIADLEDRLARMDKARAAARERAVQQALDEQEQVAAILLAAGLQLERHGDLPNAVQRYRFAASQYSETRSGKLAKERLDAAAAAESTDSQT